MTRQPASPPARYMQDFSGVSVLRCEWPGGGEHDLRGERISIGRDAGNDITIDDDRAVSRHHAFLLRTGEGWTLHDAHSRNGTLVNGERITERPLLAGDRITIGSWVLSFVEPDDPQATIDARSSAPTASMPTGREQGREPNRERGRETGRGIGPPETGEVAVPITAREREVLALVADGATDMQIAAALYISVATVRSHLDRIRDKTGCRRRPELTRLAVDLGLR